MLHCAVLPTVCDMSLNSVMPLSFPAGTEDGITEPEATFSACFGGAFLMWHPMKYASMLAEKMQQHGTHAWLVNTGRKWLPSGCWHESSFAACRVSCTCGVRVASCCVTCNTSCNVSQDIALVMRGRCGCVQCRVVW
jgi:hypothetical protein